MTEARDQMAARRAAYAWAARFISTADVKSWDLTPEAVAEVSRLRDALWAAGKAEDGDLSAIEDGDPAPGKCQTPDCPGPHGLPERRKKR